MPEQNDPVATVPRNETLADLEWQAIDEPAAAAGLYRTAGNRYLEGDDPANAVRCYGNALDADPTDVNEMKDDDNWLLMAIKLARRKEADACERRAN